MILLALLLVSLLLVILYFKVNVEERFVGEPDTYSELDTKLHKKVFSDKEIYEYEVDALVKNVITKKDAVILDAGTGVGTYYQLLVQKLPKAEITGVDRSTNMLKAARLANSSGNFVQGDLNDRGLFNAKKFDYIIATMDTLYYSRDNLQILDNFHYWLKDGGEICVHLYDPKKLDPGPQQHSQYYKGEDNNRHSMTYFNGFAHDAYWALEEDGGVSYNQTFILDDKSTKSKRIKLYIPSSAEMVKRIEKVGFKLDNIFNLHPFNIADREMFCFKKLSS